MDWWGNNQQIEDRRDIYWLYSHDFIVLILLLCLLFSSVFISPSVLIPPLPPELACSPSSPHLVLLHLLFYSCSLLNSLLLLLSKLFSTSPSSPPCFTSPSCCLHLLLVFLISSTILPFPFLLSIFFASSSSCSPHPYLHLLFLLFLYISPSFCFPPVYLYLSLFRNKFGIFYLFFYVNFVEFWKHT